MHDPLGILGTDTVQQSVDPLGILPQKKSKVGGVNGGQVGTSVPQSVRDDYWNAGLPQQSDKLQGAKKWEDFSFMPSQKEAFASDLNPHDPLQDAQVRADILQRMPNKEKFDAFTKVNSQARDIANVVSRNGFVGENFVSKVIGDDPNKYSIEQLQEKTKDNRTAQTAISGIADKRKVQDAIRTTTDPYRAAVKYTTGEENELQHKLTPEETGEAFRNFKNNPNVQEYAKTNPEFNKTFKEAQSNWMNNFPQTAQKDIAETVGNKLVEDGKSGLFTVPTNAEIDKAASKVLDGKQMDFYNRNMKPNIGTLKELWKGQTIPTPDIVHTALRAYDRGQGDLYEGTRHFVDNLSGGTISALGEGADARQQRLLNKDFSTPQVEPKGDVAKTVTGAVDMAAYMVPSIVASATGAPVMAPMAAQFYGHNWTEGMKLFRDNPEKQEGYADLTTAIDMMAGEKLPIKGIGDKVSSILNDVESGAISKVTGKQRFLNFLGETFQGTNALKAMQIGQDVAEKVFEGKNIDPEEIVKNAIKTYPKDVIPMAFFSGVHAAIEASGGKVPTETPPPKEELKNELSDVENKAIEAINNKDLSKTGLAHFVAPLKDENATVEQKRDALKQIHDQLTASGTEITTGEQLGKAADAVYELGYEKPTESEAVKEVLQPKESPKLQDLKTQKQKLINERDNPPTREVTETNDEGEPTGNVVTKPLKKADLEKHIEDRNTEIKKIDEQTKEIMDKKPELQDLSLVKADDFEKAKDSDQMDELAAKQKRIKKNFDNLKKISDCIWAI